VVLAAMNGDDVPGDGEEPRGEGFVVAQGI